MSFYLTDGDRGVAVHVEDDDDDDDDEYETPSSTAPPSRRNRHGRTYGPHTESLVGLFSLPLDDEIASESISPRRHTTPPPTTTPLTSSSNCYGSFVPLPRKSAKCDDDDDDGGGDGDAFDSAVGRRRRFDAPPNDHSSQLGGRDEMEKEDDGTMIERSSSSFLVRRDNNEEEGPWPSSSFSLFSFVDQYVDLAAPFFARNIDARRSISWYSSSRKRARSHVPPSA